MCTDKALNALCALINQNFSRSTIAVDQKIVALKAAILLERVDDDTIFCGWGGTMEALLDGRDWILRGAYKVLDGKIVEDWANL